MRIGIDARLYTQTGVGRYLKNILKSLVEIDTKNEYVVYVRSKDFGLINLPKNQFTKKIVNIPWHSISEQILFPKILLHDNLDLAHFPYFNVPILYPKPYLLTIHDLIIDHFDTGRATTLPLPIFRLKRLGYKVSITSGIKRANAITAISQTTKQEIIDHYHVSGKKISVTYDALDLTFENLLKSKNKKPIYQFPYMLYVGNAYPHKNLERFLVAFNKISKNKSIKLVLAGNDSFFYPRLQKYAHSIGLSKNVIFFGSANDIDLIRLYSYAKCLIFPSLMEGFGLPNLEAIMCGTLPVISNIPVFTEIWNSSLPMFNPKSVDDMGKKVSEVLQYDSKTVQSKVTMSQSIVKSFSWKKSALKTLELYESIGKQNNQ